MTPLRGRAAGKFHVKACGKAHAYCNTCKPDRRSCYTSRTDFGFMNADVRKKAVDSIVLKGSFAGENNPNWKGGRMSVSRAGWNAARREVLKRDIVCRACGLAPHLNRKLDVHHIVAKRDGGSNEVSNLVGLHHSCHMLVEHNKIKLEG